MKSGVSPPGSSAVIEAGAGAATFALRQDNSFLEARHEWVVLAAVWAASAAYLAAYLGRGWFPSDAGMLAEMADRVLRGQVPFRDFGEIYTGGLTYLNALAFRLFGVNLFSLRIPLFVFFLGWVPAFYFIARRFGGPITAGAATLLAVVWGVPNYPEGMPSNYNLFFATWGALALLRYVESERKRWLWIAGLCGGFSFLAKIPGLYFVAAGLLFFVFRELWLAARAAREASRRSFFYPAFATCGLLLFLAALARLTAQRPSAAVFFSFDLPSAALVVFLVVLLWRNRPAEKSGARLGRLFGMALPFVAGAAIPPALFALWLARCSALADWARGVFSLSLRHVLWAANDPLSPAVAMGLAPLAVALIGAFWAGRRRDLVIGGAVALGLAATLAAARLFPEFYGIVGLSPIFAIPLAALAAPFCFGRAGSADGIRRQEAWVVLSTAVVCAIVGFPFSEISYPTAAVLPLCVLAVLALASLRMRTGGSAMGAIAVFYLAFALWLHAPPRVMLEQDIAGPPVATPLRAMTLPRAGGLVVSTRLGGRYEAVIRAMQEHARGKYIYATPDIPEVYFLSGFRNPTPTILDFLDPDFPYPPVRDERILHALEDHDVHVVVLGPGLSVLSGKVQPDLSALLDARYPESETIGNFEVRWER